MTPRGPLGNRAACSRAMVAPSLWPTRMGDSMPQAASTSGSSSQASSSR